MRDTHAGRGKIVNYVPFLSLRRNVNKYRRDRVHAPLVLGRRVRNWPLRRLRELVREIGNGAGIDLALVPLLDHGEIGRAGLIIFAALPAVAREIIRSRGQDVGYVVQEVAAAIAVATPRIFVPGRWHELGLAELARPGAAHLLGRKITAIDDPQPIHQLTAEFVGAPAVIGQRRQRTQGLELAVVDPKIRLQSHIATNTSPGTP